MKTSADRKSENSQDTRNKVTVVVPVYNNCDNLHQCLAALSASTYNLFDVLVVDDGSTESIKPLVDYFGYGYFQIDRPDDSAQASEVLVFLKHGQDGYIPAGYSLG